MVSDLPGYDSYSPKNKKITVKRKNKRFGRGRRSERKSKDDRYIDDFVKKFLKEEKNEKNVKKPSAQQKFQKKMKSQENVQKCKKLSKKTKSKTVVLERIFGKVSLKFPCNICTLLSRKDLKVFLAASHISELPSRV